MPIERIKTGVEGLDRLIDLGIPKNHLVLISGQTGAGKTILSLQFLVEGAKKFKEKGLFISFEESRDDIIAQSNSFPWGLEDLEKKGLIKIVAFDPSKDHLTSIIEKIVGVVKEFKPSRLVLDSISTYGVYAETLGLFETMMDLGLKKEDLFLAPTPQSVTRKAIMGIMRKIKSFNVTSFVIAELPENTDFLSRDTISEFFADGVILIYHTTIGGETFGNIQVRKMRSTKHKHDLYPTIIGKKGIEVGEESADILK